MVPGLLAYNSLFFCIIACDSAHVVIPIFEEDQRMSNTNDTLNLIAPN